MTLKTLSHKNRPAMAFVGFPVDITLIIRLIIFLLRLIAGGLPGVPVL